MKKIGILTIQSADNYGCVLQCMALRSKVSELRKNLSVEVVNYVMPGSRRIKYTVSRDDFKRVQKNKGTKEALRLCFNSLRLLPFHYKRKRVFGRFRDEFYNLQGDEFDDVYMFGNLSYDEYVVGSDQVWNYALTHDKNDVFFLPGVSSEVTKISYAASTGRTDYDDTVTDWLKKGTAEFKAIAVREKTAVKNLSKLLGRDIVGTVDPTLLYPREFWEKIERKPSGMGNKPYIFMYGLGYSWCKEREAEACKTAKCIADAKGLQVIHYYYGDYKRRFSKDSKCCYFEGPREFLWLMHHAEYAILCSFHGTVFACLYERPFYTFSTGGNGTRMKDLVELLGIGDRFVLNSLSENEWDWNIDWETVRTKLESERKKSIRYLDDNLIGDN